MTISALRIPNRDQGSPQASGHESPAATGHPGTPQATGATPSMEQTGKSDGHNALHLWFIDNPDGRFADFSPRLSCPLESAPGGLPATDVPKSSIAPEDHNAPH